MGLTTSIQEDHLGAVRELIDSSGNIQARYDYDPMVALLKFRGAQSLMQISSFVVTISIRSVG